MFQLIQGLTGFVGKQRKNNNNRSYSCTLYVGVHVYPLGLSLSFEASVANKDSPVTSHINL